MVSRRLQRSGFTFVTAQNILFNATFIPNATCLALTGRLIVWGTVTQGGASLCPGLLCSAPSGRKIPSLRFAPFRLLYHKRSQIAVFFVRPFPQRGQKYDNEKVISPRLRYNQLSENAAHLLFSKRRDCLVQSRFPIFSQSNKRSERRFNVENNFLIEFFQLFADIFFDISPIGYGVEPIACV